MAKIVCNVTVGTHNQRSAINKRKWLHGYSWWIKTEYGTVHDTSQSPPIPTRQAAMKLGRETAKRLGFEIVRKKVTLNPLPYKGKLQCPLLSRSDVNKPPQPTKRRAAKASSTSKT